MVEAGAATWRNAMSLMTWHTPPNQVLELPLVHRFMISFVGKLGHNIIQIHDNVQFECREYRRLLAA